MMNFCRKEKKLSQTELGKFSGINGGHYRQV
jgi:hypothetical protein